MNRRLLFPIRHRAYATAFREVIYDERKWELAAEAHRRYDLKRWGILLEVVQNLEYRFWKPNENIRPWHVLLPIPLTELQLNPKLLESDPTNKVIDNSSRISSFFHPEVEIYFRPLF